MRRPPSCPKQRVSCCNCGQPHRAWQKKTCRLFQTYLEDIQARRVKLVTGTAAIRAAAGPQAPTLSTSDFTFIASGKRNRERPPAGNRQTPQKRGSGRPPECGDTGPGQESEQYQKHVLVDSCLTSFPARVFASLLTGRLADTLTGLFAGLFADLVAGINTCKSTD